MRRNSPQQGQRPSLATGPVTSARSQWPRASHCGLMHCTVKPGRYCIVYLRGRNAPPIQRRPFRSASSRFVCHQTAHRRTGRSPCDQAARRSPPEGERLARGSRAKAHGQEPRGNSAFNGGHSALTNFWCQEKNTTRNCGKVAAVKNMVCVPGRAAGPESRVLKCVQSQEAEAVRKSDHAA